MEVFVLFNIEYCDGEDLMQLYWGFWSVLQVGSCVAIFGTMLQLCIVMGNVGNPSWAVALGTPVLVFAALGWLCREVGRQALRKILRREVEGPDKCEDKESDVEHWIRTVYSSHPPQVQIPHANEWPGRRPYRKA